ncbi:hypothetical protein DK28_0204320 [Peptococcaceae bacterium SCADC1_2_3]|nr:hypothetical protein DK28_0204320 [Peptococcaceae bacterium SCADC1_2_3]
MLFNFRKRKEGFTLIETIVSVALVGILVCATITIFKSQAIFTYRTGELSEMQDNLRTASYWLTKDIREATKVLQLVIDSDKEGPEPKENNALVFEVRGQKIAYFYGSDSMKNTFYRATDYNLDQKKVPKGNFQPLTNEYTFGGKSKGYVRGWLVQYFSYDSNGNKVEVTNPNYKDEVRIVTFTLYGSYGDKPDDFKPFSSSAFIRSLATP